MNREKKQEYQRRYRAKYPEKYKARMKIDSARKQCTVVALRVMQNQLDELQRENDALRKELFTRGRLYHIANF